MKRPSKIFSLLLIFLLFDHAKSQESSKKLESLKMVEHKVIEEKVDGKKWAILKANIKNSSNQDISFEIQKTINNKSKTIYYNITEPFIEIEVKAAGTEFWYPITRMGSWTKNKEHVLKPGESVWIEKKLVGLDNVTEIERKQYQSYIKNGFRITLKGRSGSSEEKMIVLFERIVFLSESGEK